MIRYVTLTANKTIDKISNNEFDGATKIFVDSDKEATLIYSPYLCWVDDNGVVHIPNDSPVPAFQKQIADLQTKLTDSQNESQRLIKQLNQSNSDNDNLKKQVDSLSQGQMQLLSQIAQLKGGTK
ncbi:hypothetical protein [Apilactobacillus xinyiensis]|uniref:hypothetical protein n=1 Tax=Apilactobacillus xinyiensis TaxID=2841032 RepID=UPI00200F0421|nr:hypothetical protein [Apilactobacillus xinyiensis]MCL0330542.1 hypothetical protein [Apilactobacillus xinyiensis]